MKNQFRDLTRFSMYIYDIMILTSNSFEIQIGKSYYKMILTD